MRNNRKKIFIGLGLLGFLFLGLQFEKELEGPRDNKKIDEDQAFEDTKLEGMFIEDAGDEPVKRSLASVKSTSVSEKYAAILKDSKFKRYKNISFKVIRTKEEKEEHRKILRDETLLSQAVDLIKSDSKRFSHDLEVAHLDISQFLLEALKLNGSDQVVVGAIKKILEVNLSEQQGVMSEKAYNLLKEDKAEIMYSAIATNKQIAKWYTPDSTDTVSKKIYENVNNRYKSNVAESKRMISQR